MLLPWTTAGKGCPGLKHRLPNSKRAILFAFLERGQLSEQHCLQDIQHLKAMVKTGLTSNSLQPDPGARPHLEMYH